ncbi:MAG TPA: winged helix-turn-helix domain-containing protein [Terracidiphilus sp.]|nr:winged helix-turn-helix domain-containing protein [Terracidiphilus sp.]
MDWTNQPSSGSPDSTTANTGAGRGEEAIVFSGFRLEADGSLYRGDALLHLPPRELAALRLLLAHAGQIVTPLQLKQALWGNVHVTADSVPRCLSSLRARLQPDDCIQTVYKRGYRLVGEVRRFAAPPATDLPRLAIPPFATRVGVPEHLGTAIAEETIARLSNARRPLAYVLARDSVFTLALRGLTAQQIGEALKADLVLVGTLRAFPTLFLLRVEMIRIVDGIQIWVEDLFVDRSKITGSETELINRLNFRLGSVSTGSVAGVAPVAREAVLPAEAADALPTLQDTQALASSLKWGAEARSISAAAGPEPESESSPMRREAYEAFLRGHHEWQTLQRHRMQDGLQHLMRATELDPSLIAAKVDLAHLCVTQALYGFMSPAAAADLVHRTAESVPDFPLQGESILPALAWVNFHFDHDLPGALWAFELSAHLPHDPSITRARSTFALSRRRFPEAIALLRAAIQLDPFSPWLQCRLAWAYHLSGQAEESVAQIERVVRLFPEHEGTAFYGSLILAFNGDPVRAAQLGQNLVQREPYLDLAAACHAYALACGGRTTEAQAILERLQWLSRERYVLKTFTPAVYVALGDLDAALTELRAANEARCPWFFQMLADPRLKPLHGQPEFEQLQAILSRMEATAAQPAAQSAPNIQPSDSNSP